MLCEMFVCFRSWSVWIILISICIIIYINCIALSGTSLPVQCNAYPASPKMWNVALDLYPGPDGGGRTLLMVAICSGGWKVRVKGCKRVIRVIRSIQSQKSLVGRHQSFCVELVVVSFCCEDTQSMYVYVSSSYSWRKMQLARKIRQRMLTGWNVHPVVCSSL